MAFVWALVLAGCSSSVPSVREQLDPVTAVTTTRAGAPLVLYRDNSARAAYARDYVYLGPIEVNRMGERRYFLWLGIWSTLGDAYIDAAADGFEGIALYADGEPLLLEATGWTLEAIGVTEPLYVKPVASAVDAYYPVTLDQVRMIANARDIRLQTTSARSETYLPWDDQATGQAAMRAFVEYLER